MHTITTMLQRPIVRVALAGIVLAAVAALGNRIQQVEQEIARDCWLVLPLAFEDQARQLAQLVEGFALQPGISQGLHSLLARRFEEGFHLLRFGPRFKYDFC